MNPITKDFTPTIAIVYHSSYGHTRRVAHAIARGANAQLDAKALDILQLSDDDWAYLDNADLIVFGSAVYMGSVTAAFKAFMDSTSKRWVARTWQGKFAAGFANSGGLSGDKLAVLQQITLFAMQHGMNWVGMPLMPTGSSEQDLNRLSSFLGLMTQSIDAPVEETPCEGDMATALWFGEHLAQTVLRFVGNR
ncbi:flavodoxin [Moraxella caviae]|uniref:Flavodoxin n=1 Tax=Moraxella caviae TaxID=34060 RepID=A0A1T0A448_9GAMM|nr:flavodoxin family protein [Moraxella caviae]OOR90091.1 flavodoxin [Moraxella caviae]STZ14709.1 Trp repressor-binding protein [Moraxella caviae]VEW11426.1 Trp repressor-binding protein [Moraxella caviae]